MSVSCSQRMLSLWLRRLPTDRIARLREFFLIPPLQGRVGGRSEPGWGEPCRIAPHPAGFAGHPPPSGRDAPLVVYGKRGNAELLTAVDDAAERLGLSPGMALAQARAMHPGIEAIAEDAEADSQLLEAIADWCLRYTPLVACDPPDGLLLDISGCAHLYGGEDALVADLSGRLEKTGFAYRIAIAGSIGAAHAAAHHGAPGRYACGQERALLSPLPLTALRLEPGTAASLRASASSASAT